MSNKLDNFERADKQKINEDAVELARLIYDVFVESKLNPKGTAQEAEGEDENA